MNGSGATNLIRTAPNISFTWSATFERRHHSLPYNILYAFPQWGGGEHLPLARSVRQGCPLSPYLFIMATDVLGHMLDDHHFGVEGLALSGGGKITNQTFANDTVLYLHGMRDNMEKTQKVLDIFCKASGAKINWNKLCVIWASKRNKDWEWGREVGL